jgi:hypothetical protein
MQRRLVVLLALIGCGGDRVPVYSGSSFAHDPPPIGSMAGKIVVTDNGDDTLSIVDPAAPAPAKRLPVGFNPVELEGPHHLSVDPAGKYVYVNLSMALGAAAAGPHGSHGASTLPGWVLKLDTNGGAEVGRAQVEANPGDNTLTADGKTLYVTHYDLPRWVAGATMMDLRKGDSDLLAIDTATMTVKSRTPICPAAHGVRLSASGDHLYATCGPDEIAVVDLPALTVRRVPLVPGLVEAGNCARCPYALSVAPDGVVWVSSVGSGTTGRGLISLFDPTLPGGGDFDQAAAVQLRGGALFAAFVGDATSYRAYVPIQSPAGDHVLVYQPQPRGTPPVQMGDFVLDRADCQNAHMLRTDGNQGQLVCEGDHVNPGTFVWLDLAATKVIGSVKIGVFPDGLALVKAP